MIEYALQFSSQSFLQGKSPGETWISEPRNHPFPQKPFVPVTRTVPALPFDRKGRCAKSSYQVAFKVDVFVRAFFDDKRFDDKRALDYGSVTRQ